MKYKALFLDLDGTTVPSKLDGMPSERVRDAIHRAKSKVFVCVATSRPLQYAKPVLDYLDIRGLCSVNDATQIYDPHRSSKPSPTSSRPPLMMMALPLSLRSSF